MNWLDIVIFIFLIFAAVDGYFKGFLRGIINLISVISGFLVALFSYHGFANFINKTIYKASIDFIEIFSLIFLFLITTFFINILGTILIDKIKKLLWLKLDEIAGIFLGFFTGIVIAGLIFLFLSVLPQKIGLANLLKNSFLAPKITKITSQLYKKAESKISSKLPQLIRYPEQAFGKGEYQKVLSDINESQWKALDKATCYNCGGKVKYMGVKEHLVSQEKVSSPYFVCTKCGRHSDSCQTFEGYHKLYNECPVLLARQGVRFDCGMWPNGNFVKPKGRCPIDGNVAKVEEHHQFSKEVLTQL